MVDEITAHLMDALEALKRMPSDRETALAITKVEEALMWWGKQR